MKHSIWLVLTMIAAAALAFEARADSLPPFQPDRSLPPVAQLGQYLKRLDSDDWRTRESTTFQLARDQRISEDVIERSLSGTTLSQEQRLRLLRALETRLLLLPRGAIGVSMKRSITTFTDKDGNDISGVEIVELLPGMPAEEQLRVGDVLMSIEGQAFDHSDHVSSLIKQYWPGDEVELQVARDEPADAAGTPRRSRILTIRIKLGSTDQLATRSRTNPIPTGDRAMAENRIRSMYQRYAPGARRMQAPSSLPGQEQVGDLPIGIDPELILQQVREDRIAMDQKVPGSLTPEAFEAKWASYVGSLTDLLDSGLLDAESGRLIEQLRARILELVDIED